jgi:hypothetical protein
VTKAVAPTQICLAFDGGTEPDLMFAAWTLILIAEAPLFACYIVSIRPGPCQAFFCTRILLGCVLQMKVLEWTSKRGCQHSAVRLA